MVRLLDKSAAGKIRGMPSDDPRQLERRFFSLKEIAHTLGTSGVQVYALVRSGELAAIRIGGRGQWRIEDEALERWVEQRYADTREWVAANPQVREVPSKVG